MGRYALHTKVETSVPNNPVPTTKTERKTVVWGSANARPPRKIHEPLSRHYFKPANPRRSSQRSINPPNTHPSHPKRGPSQPPLPNCPRAARTSTKPSNNAELYLTACHEGRKSGRIENNRTLPTDSRNQYTPHPHSAKTSGSSRLYLDMVFYNDPPDDDDKDDRIQPPRSSLDLNYNPDDDEKRIPPSRLSLPLEDVDATNQSIDATEVEVNKDDSTAELEKLVKSRDILTSENVCYNIVMPNGKDRRLFVLAQRNNTGVISGDILVNGSPLDQSFHRRTVYVQQQDLRLAESTVREALRFSSLPCQPKAVRLEEKYEYFETVIKMLEMEDYASAVIGTPGSGLNVEQRKSTTNGEELFAKPAVLLFLDEPTSGLDS
ncbi:ATP-binding cassette transporter snq2 [Rhizina undulata]